MDTSWDYNPYLNQNSNIDPSITRVLQTKYPDGSTPMTGNGLKGPAGLANIGSAGVGLLNTVVGLAGLSKMGDAPQYSLSPELQQSYQRAQQYANSGLTPEEYNNAQNSITRSNNTAYQNAVDMSGGNLAGAVRGAINAQNLDANNNLAAMDANQHRQNMQYADSLSGEVQNQRNLITQNQINNYNQKAAAYGGSLKSGLEGLGNWGNMLSLLTLL